MVKCIEFTAVKTVVRMICIHMDITGIDLFDQIVSMACTKVRLRCSWILCLIHMGIQDVGFFYVNKMGTKQHSRDVHMGLRLRMHDL